MGNTADPEPNDEAATDEEIDDMISALEGGGETSRTEESSEESSEEETPDQTEDSTRTEQESTEEVQAAEEDEETETSEVEELRQEIQELKSSLSEDAEGGEDAEASSDTEEETEQLEVEVNFEDEDFVDEDLHAEVLSNPENFNEFLKDFAENIAARTQEEILQKFPQLVDQRVQERVSAETTMQRFWSENPDLDSESKRQVLASKAQEVRSEDPSLSLQEVLSEAEERTRDELDLKEQAEEIDEEAQEAENPAFTPDQGTSPTPNQDDTRGEQVKQIDQMLDAVG